jgi:DNA-directed RNA polymerase delta subunit
MEHAIAEAVQATFEDPAEFEILARRYGMAGRPRMTLQEIADAVGLVRERIRQREERIVALLQSALLRDDYAEKPFCFAPGFCAPFRTTYQRLDDPAVRFWREPQLLTMIADSLQLVEEEVLPHLELFVDLLGWRKQQPQPRLEAIYGRREDLSFPTTAKVVARIDEILSREPLGLDSYQLAGRINRQFPNLSTPATIHELVHLCSTCEVLTDGRFRCRFSWLRSLADKAFVVLLDAGEPLHFEKITEEISRRQLERGREAALSGIRANLGKDQRFVPIARTGLWKLTSWEHVDARPIADIAKEILRLADRPLHTDQIFDEISQRRPRVLRGSVRTLLANDGRFVSVAPSIWALTVWDEDRRAGFEAPSGPLRPVQAEAIAADFIAQAPNGRLLRDVVKHLATVDQRSEGSAYRIISDSTRFRFSEAPNRRGKVVHLAASGV